MSLEKRHDFFSFAKQNKNATFAPSNYNKNKSIRKMELIPIEDKIYEIRGRRVMLDFDLASMYQVETKRLKEQVRRNIERFPDDFMFKLTKREWTELVANCDQLPKI